MLKYDKLFKLLSQNGYTVTKVKETGLMGQATYYGIQKGEKNLDGKTINKLCALFKCQPNDLIEYYPDDISFNSNEELSKKLFNLRNKHKLSPSDAANEFNITRAEYDSYESGTKNPPLDILLKACKLYNVPQSYFGINSDLQAVGNKGYFISNTENSEIMNVTSEEFEMLKKVLDAYKNK